MALAMILRFDFFWNEFLQTIGMIFGSALSFWLLFYLGW
jgi:hypothetical protein